MSSLLASGGGVGGVGGAKFDTLRPPQGVHKVVDEANVTKTRSLKQYMDLYVPTEQDQKYKVREQIVEEVERLFMEWVRQCYLQQDGLTDAEREEVEDFSKAKREGKLGCILVAGSHRLGIKDVEADVDACCVVPNFCTKEGYFATFAESIRAQEGCSSLQKLPDVRTPNITFVYKDLDFDLLFVHYSEKEVPLDPLKYLEDNILLGLDSKSVRCLNAPRVTNQILYMLYHRDEEFKQQGSKCYENFMTCVRFVRKWAKARGIYSNKHGYFGGVNLNILVAWTCLLYPTQPAYYILYAFFGLYSNPESMYGRNCVKLNKVETNFFTTMEEYITRMHIAYDDRDFEELLPWDEERLEKAKDEWRKYGDPKLLAKLKRNYISIITPSFPAANSMEAATFDSRIVINEEFAWAFEHIQQIEKVTEPTISHWNSLLEPTDFFFKYSRYVRVTFYSTLYPPEHEREKEKDEDYKGYASYMDAYSLKNIYDEIKQESAHYLYHLYPKSVKVLMPDGCQATTYYMGVRDKTDKEIMDDDLPLIPRPPRGSEEEKSAYALSINTNNYKKAIVRNLNRRNIAWREDFQFEVNAIKWNELPQEVFELYKDKADSRAKRRALRDEAHGKVKAVLALAAAKSADSTTVKLSGLSGDSNSSSNSSRSISSSGGGALDALVVADSASKKRKKAQEDVAFDDDGLDTSSSLSLSAAAAGTVSEYSPVKGGYSTFSTSSGQCMASGVVVVRPLSQNNHSTHSTHSSNHNTHCNTNNLKTDQLGLSLSASLPIWFDNGEVHAVKNLQRKVMRLAGYGSNEDQVSSDTTLALTTTNTNLSLMVQGSNIISSSSSSSSKYVRKISASPLISPEVDFFLLKKK